MVAPGGPVAALLRRRDADRYLTALFAPAASREPLMLLYAVGAELARARLVSDPTLGLVRLQWWREVIEGVARRHEIATPLQEALACGVLDRGTLLDLVEAQEALIETPAATHDAWLAERLATDGGLAAAAGHLLGARGASLAVLRSYGAAYGIARVRFAAGSVGDAPIARYGPDRPYALNTLITDGLTLLRDAGYPVMPNPGKAAGLIAVLAWRDLRAASIARRRTTLDRLAVLRVALKGNRRPVAEAIGRQGFGS